MKQYYAESMETTAPEKGYSIVFLFGAVTLQRVPTALMPADFGHHTAPAYAVRYGKQVWAEMNYAEAAKELGECLMHQQVCNGWFDRSNARGPIDPNTYDHRTIDELDQAGYFMFIAEPHTDFNPEALNEDGMMAGIQVTFAEALIDMDAEPVDDDSNDCNILGLPDKVTQGRLI